MMGTINCVYETPCGWCAKWDKKCDRKPLERGQRAKCNPIDDAATNEICQAAFDWFIGKMDGCSEYKITYPSSKFELVMRRK